jgi:hypothetical protein
MNPSDAETFESLLQSIRGCVSWHDIQAKWQNLSEKRKGDLFEELVKAYLQLDPEYASKLKHVWLGSEVPQAIARKLKLPATDQGIDIVTETHDGEFWAVQCKYRKDTDHSLTWRDLSTFTGLAFGVCQGFSFGIVCSTTERITHVLRDQHGQAPPENSPAGLWLRWAEVRLRNLDPLGEGFRPWNGSAFRQIPGLFPEP